VRPARVSCRGSFARGAQEVRNKLDSLAAGLDTPVGAWAVSGFAADGRGRHMFQPKTFRGGRVRVYGCSPGCLVLSLTVSIVVTLVINLLIRALS
jgi:hypothetical protein